jgi:hypothetical protein
MKNMTVCWKLKVDISLQIIKSAMIDAEIVTSFHVWVSGSSTAFEHCAVSCDSVLGSAN